MALMSKEDELERVVLDFYLASAREGAFNGLPALGALKVCGAENSPKEVIKGLVSRGSVECVFERRDVNPHIKRLPVLPKDKQLELIQTETPTSFCLYPTPRILAKNVSPTEFSNRPFSRALLLGEAQLSYATFELGVLGRYRDDPRYIVKFHDYMGDMFISDDFYQSDDVPERDKISVETFGLAIDENQVPHIVVFYRYLADLTAEHQQYWNSFRAKHVPMCEEYFQASVLGEWWENRSIRHAIQEEIRIINEISIIAFSTKLFRMELTDDLPFDLSAFLVPSSDSFSKFVHSWDKLLSENIDKAFFKGKIELTVEEPKPDGQTSVRHKGTLQLLKEWLNSKITGPDKEEIVATVVEPLQTVRKLRQRPAHTFQKNEFSRDFFEKRRNLLTEIHEALTVLRIMFARLPSGRDVEIPDWLDEGPFHAF